MHLAHQPLERADQGDGDQGEEHADPEDGAEDLRQGELLEDGGDLAADEVASGEARNQMPIIWLTTRWGASLVIVERPTGLRQSSPTVCRR